MVGLKKILLHLKLHKVFLKNHSQIFSECNLKFHGGLEENTITS